MHFNYLTFFFFFFFFIQCFLIHPTQSLQQHQNSTSQLISKKSLPPTQNPSRKFFDYSGFYYRSNQKLKPCIIILFVTWVTFLFSFVGIVASDFFCPNLSTISSRLNLSESLAGVTLLGFGNGAPDVFSTFAAFRSNTGSLAIGELVGASLFIVSVVVGTMSIVRPFKVPRHSFLRDLTFFIIAIVFVLIIIVDRGISPWQANCLVLIYLTYVVSVLLSSWSYQRIHHKRDQLRIARSVYSQDDQLLEPYHDDPDFPIQPTPEDNNQTLLIGHTSREEHDLAATRLSPQHSPLSHLRSQRLSAMSSSTMSSHSDSFKSLLETSYPISIPVGNRRTRAPSISYQSNVLVPPVTNLINSSTSSSSSNSPILLQGNSPWTHSSESPEDDLSSPDNLKRRPRRNTIMINGPIRPSLLGAIEFRDVVNSLNRDTSIHSAFQPASPHLAHRRFSLSRHPRSSSMNMELPRENNWNSSTGPAPRISPIHDPFTSSGSHPLDEFRSESRTENSDNFRALSNSKSSNSIEVNNTNQVPKSRRIKSFPLSKSLSSRSEQQKQSKDEARGRQPQTFRSDSKTQNLLAGDRQNIRTNDRLQSSSETLSLSRHSNRPSSPPVPSILITTDQHEVIQLPDTPLAESTPRQDQVHRPNIRLNLPHLAPTTTGLSQRKEKRKKDWNKLARTVWETLFPTLKDWRMKSRLGRFLALFSAPAVFILTLTLPVVVDETEENVVTEYPDEDDQPENLADMNDVKVSQNDSHRSRLVSPMGLSENYNLLLTCEEEGQVGLEIEGVFVEEEDPSPDDEDVYQNKKSSNPNSENAANLNQSERHHDEEVRVGGVISKDEVQDAERMIEDEGMERVAYSSQNVARILATVQTFLAPPFWVICFLDQDEQIDSSAVKNHLSNSTELHEHMPSVLPNSAYGLFWVELIASSLVGLLLSKIVFETLKNQNGNVSNNNSVGDENNLHFKGLKSIEILKKMNLKKIIKIGLCLIGFINSMIYILLIVNQLIEILNFFATLFNISDSILGLTIFGIGNSLGDFVANFTVAKMGFPVMAISACFGGPMLNILLGIGVSARLVMSSTSKLNKKEGMKDSDGNVIATNNTIRIESSTSLLISTLGLLIILITMLVLIPLKKSFLFDRSVGFSLILSYSFVFFVNLMVECYF